LKNATLWMMTLTLVAVASGAWAMTPMELVQKAMQVQGQVLDYMATVTVSIKAPNLQIPARTVKVYYKKPDKLHVESQGLAIVPRDALLMGDLASHLEDNTQASLVATGTLNDRPVTCVKLTPLDQGPGTGRVLVWIDTERFLLVKTEVWDVARKMMTINFTHTLVQQRHWMPLWCSSATGCPARSSATCRPGCWTATARPRARRCLSRTIASTPA